MVFKLLNDGCCNLCNYQLTDNIITEINNIFSLQMRPYSLNGCTSGDGMRMETNFCGDG